MLQQQQQQHVKHKYEDIFVCFDSGWMCSAGLEIYPLAQLSVLPHISFNKVS